MSHYNIAKKAIFGLSVALLFIWGITLHKKNKSLSESLEMAQNNIEAYQGVVSNLQEANGVLKLDMADLENLKDEVLLKLDSVRKELNLKPKLVSTAATQTLKVNVTASRGTGGLVIVKDTIYNDSIKYNDLTTVHYTIGNDTISIGIDLLNTLYLYIYSKREYKNKKKFLKRLFTFDFKKVTKYKYDIVNTNDLLRSEDVRIIESTSK